MTNQPPVLEYRTPAKQVRRMRRRSLGEELFKVAAIASVFVQYGLYGDPYKPVVVFFALGCVALAGVIAVLTLPALRPSYVGTPVSIEKVWRRLIWLVLFLTLMFALWPPWGFYSCPHGTRWANRLVGIAASDNGGPCSNGSYYPRTRAWHVGGRWYVYFFPAGI